MPLTLSVIIPSYNSEMFIRETLASAVDQTVLPNEIIVVDDASIDRTCEIIELFAEQSPVPVRLIRNAKNSGGPVRGMNAGVRASTGDVLTILDHDDLLAPIAIEEHLSAWRQIDRSKVGIVTSDFTTFDVNGVICNSQFARENVLSNMLTGEKAGLPLVLAAAVARQMLCRSWCITMKSSVARDAWMNCGGFTEAFRSAWDYDFLWRLSERYEFA